ncbi:MAG TPA: methyltransferase domain-containing protein [Anaerolineales bacterium]|nr:methyltransferase domain-containing protein [Anaerolineales bacterium]
MIDQTFVLREPAIRSAIRKLQFVPNSHGLDIGCGIGNITELLTESTAPRGHVTGVDISPDKVAYARDTAEKDGLTKQLSFRLADMNDLPYDDDTFDWVWSMDCVGYLPIEPLPLIEELVRVIKPGGRIALLAWSSQQLLPGHPALEAHLNATSVGIAPFSQGKIPNQHFLRALGWLQQLGLEALKAQTFVSTVHAPLSDDIREALKSLIEMRWPGVRQELSNDDWLEFQRLCRPDSSDFILNTPDYYGFYTYSLFQGKAPI